MKTRLDQLLEIKQQLTETPHSYSNKAIDSIKSLVSKKGKSLKKEADDFKSKILRFYSEYEHLASRDESGNADDLLGYFETVSNTLDFREFKKDMDDLMEESKNL